MASGPSAGNGTLVTPLSPPVKDDQRCATPHTTKPKAMVMRMKYTPRVRTESPKSSASRVPATTPAGAASAVGTP